MRLPQKHHADSLEEWLLDDLAGCTPVITLGFLRRSPLAVKLVDRNGCILYLNGNAMTSYGIDSYDDAVGKFWWDLDQPERRHMFRNLVTRAGLGENVRVTIDGQDSRGEVQPTDISVTPVRCRQMAVNKLLVVSPTCGTAEIDG